MPDVEFLVHLLQGVRQFDRIPERELRELILAGQVGIYPEGSVIFSEDEPCAGLYVLLKGQVQICRHSPEGQVSILAVFDPVIMINEAAALDGGPNPVTAITCRETTLWRISPEALVEFLLGHAQVCLALLRVLASRNRRLVSQFQDLSFRTVTARAAKLLLELSENGGRAIDRRHHPNHQLAARISTVPEAFSRALKSLREIGVIEVTRQSIRVVSPDQLRRMAGLRLF